MAGLGGWDTDFDGLGTNGAVTNVSPAKGVIIDKIRNGLLLLGGIRKVTPVTLGSKQAYYRCTTADTYQDHPAFADFVIPWTDLKDDEGDTWTAEVIVWARCENASTTVTPRIVTAGTSTANVTGTAHASTTASTQTLTLVSSTGDVTYRIQIKQSDLLYDVQVEAELRLYI